MRPVQCGVTALALAALLPGDASKALPSQTSNKEQGSAIVAQLERAHVDLLQLHAQQPFYGGNHLPASIVTRRTQESSGTCLSGDFRVVSNARPEVSACYFDNGTTNYGLPQYTENGEFASGQFWVFPYFEDYRGGVYWAIVLYPCYLCDAQSYCISWEEATDYHPADVKSWSCIDDEDTEFYDLTTPTELSVSCGCSDTSSSTPPIPQSTSSLDTTVPTPAPESTPSPINPPTVAPTSPTPRPTPPQMPVPITTPEPTSEPTPEPTPSPVNAPTAEPTAVAQPPTPPPLSAAEPDGTPSPVAAIVAPIASVTTAPATAPSSEATASPLAATRAPAAATAAAPTVAPTPGTRGGIKVATDAPSTTVIGGGTSDAIGVGLGRGRAASLVTVVVITTAVVGALAM